MDTLNSLDEINRQAELLKVQAQQNGVSVIGTESATIKLRKALLEILSERDPTMEEIHALITQFNSALSACQGTLCTKAFINSIVGAVILSRDNADRSLISKHHCSLTSGIDQIEKSMTSLERIIHTDKYAKLKENINSLMHAAGIMANNKEEIADTWTQNDIDGYFYHCYYHLVYSRSTLLMLSSGPGKQKEDSIPQRLKAFHDSLFYFLYDASKHNRCSIPLRTCIRIHLIDFTDNQQYPWSVRQHDLRIGCADLDYTNTNSRFTLESQYRTSQYCYDIEE